MSESIDVLIVGAGLSGIGVARYLQVLRPGARYAILEARGTLGGTWDLFRYPGIRSDSDVHTYSYAFKPWSGRRQLASAASILAYLREVADENDIARHIRYHHRVVAADWHGAQARWHVEVERTDTGETQSFTCRWLLCAGGYYRYDQGYCPDFPDLQRFEGQVVHPQQWPEGLDCAGRRVLVIGSGATAATLVPALAERAGHVTMLQRTPSYVMSIPAEDALADKLPRIVGRRLSHALIRGRNILIQEAIVRFCLRFPATARRLLRHYTRRRLPAGYPVDVHFNPPYDPMTQRLCMVPDGDLHAALAAGKASIVTGHVARFTSRGVQLESGEHLPADLVVTATGFHLQAFGGMRLSVDGRRVEPADTVVYKGMLAAGVPNFAFVVGYTVSPWTLKIRLFAERFCELLAYMDRHGHAACRPVPPDASSARRPLLGLRSGYVERALHALPKQGAAYPWVMPSMFWTDKWQMRGRFVDRHLEFSGEAGG